MRIIGFQLFNRVMVQLDHAAIVVAADDAAIRAAGGFWTRREGPIETLAHLDRRAAEIVDGERNGELIPAAGLFALRQGVQMTRLVNARQPLPVAFNINGVCRLAWRGLLQRPFD